MKVYIRTLNNSHWSNESQREKVRLHLCDWGFYALTGSDDTLVVYAISDDTPLDVKILKITLDKIGNFWYTYKTKGGQNARPNE